MLTIYDEYYRAYKEEQNEYTTGNEDIWIRESKFDRDKIYQLVKDNQTEDYSKILENEDEWWVQYHLNPVRESLFNWYDFKKNASLLEVSGRLGALTGLFSDRCETVTVLEKTYQGAEIIATRYRNRKNITVYACDPEDLPSDLFEKQFDYIVINEILEEKGYGYWNQKMYSSYLKKFSSWLKAGGKILITANNRYGIKFLCGERDPHTGIPFDGINKYPGGSKGYAFSRNELEVILHGAGIRHYKFFYPLPDSFFAQIVYSDTYQNKANIGERLSCFHPCQDTLLASEISLYNDIMDNHVLGFLANIFFIESSFQSDLSEIGYSVVSTDRSRERAFSTSVYNNGLVKKKNLFPEGKEILHKSYMNIMDLKRQGVPIVPHEWSGECLKMPYFDGEGMTAVLQKKVVENTEEFEELIDLWYSYILLSSKHCSSVKYNEKTFGPILQRAYIDLVPANAFYRSGEIYFYDQEFVRERCPAKYVLYRGLKYTYMSMWDMESFYPMQKLKEKYELNDIWDLFEEEETQFIKQLKKTDVRFNKWKTVDNNRVYQRCRLLGKENIDILNFQVTKLTKAVQQVQLELLREFQKVCNDYNLSYYAFYGTLTGAVRHQGFIPWDDDIDVVMFRKDYERLLKIANHAFDNRFFLQTPENDEGCFYGNYAKLRANWTSSIELINWDKNCNQGIALDIIPLDNCFEDETKNSSLQQKILLFQRMLFAKTYDSESRIREMSENDFSMYKKLGEGFSRNELLSQLSQLFQSVPQNGKSVTIFSRYIFWKLRTFDKKDFGNGKKVKFETIDINIPDNYDKVLHDCVGNYMVYPKPEQRKAKHGDALVSVKVSFQEYRRKFRNVFTNVDGKDMILFGEGRMLDAYLNTKAEQYPPKMVVVLSTILERDTYRGFRIYSFNNLREISLENCRIIICAEDFKKYEQELLNIGIWDYYIFSHTKWWLKITED